MLMNSMDGSLKAVGREVLLVWIGTIRRCHHESDALNTVIFPHCYARRPHVLLSFRSKAPFPAFLQNKA